MSLRVLMFAYYFPPSAGPGVRRSVRFVTELPRQGVEPIVVTVRGSTFRNPEEFGMDEAALADIPEGVRVERTSAWSLPRLRGALTRLKLMRVALMAFYPVFWERQALWVFPAVRRALRLVEELQPDVVYTSTGPFSANLIGLALRHVTGIPWVTDYRDLWTGSWIKWWPSRVHHALEQALERRVLRTADAVVANTPGARLDLARMFPDADPRRIHVIPNGWDDRPEDPAPRPPPADRILLLHTGSFEARADGDEDGRQAAVRGWIRSKLEYRLPAYELATHGPGTLLGALAEARRLDPGLADRLCLRLVGHVHDSWRGVAERLGVTDLVDFAGSCPFEEARRMQREADVLVMTTVSRRDGGPVPRVNAKLYEYIHAGRPILLLSHDGDAARIAREAGLGIVFGPKDVRGIGAFLRDLAADREGTLEPFHANPEVVAEYSRAALTARLVSVLRGVARSGDAKADGPAPAPPGGS